MTGFAHSSITDSVVGASVSASSERICSYLKGFDAEGTSRIAFSWVVLRPICVPEELGEIGDQIKITRGGKEIQIFYNIPYGGWADRSMLDRDETNTKSLIFTLRNSTNRRLNDKKKDNLIDLISRIELEELG
jgi:hypothetical protein